MSLANASYSIHIMAQQMQTHRVSLAVDTVYPAAT